MATTKTTSKRSKSRNGSRATSSSAGKGSASKRSARSSSANSRSKKRSTSGSQNKSNVEAIKDTAVEQDEERGSDDCRCRGKGKDSADRGRHGVAGCCSRGCHQRSALRASRRTPSSVCVGHRCRSSTWTRSRWLLIGSAPTASRLPTSRPPSRRRGRRTASGRHARQGIGVSAPTEAQEERLRLADIASLKTMAPRANGGRVATGTLFAQGPLQLPPYP